MVFPSLGRTPGPGARCRPAVERLEDRSQPSVSYHGGPLLANVVVETLYYGSAWATDPTLGQQATQLNAFFTDITDSSYLDQLGEYSTQSYDIDRGQFLGGTTDPVSLAAGTTVTDRSIRGELNKEISAGLLPPPDANRLYVVFTPPNVHVSLGGQNSINNFLGYHSNFVSPSGTTGYYAVVVSQQGNAALAGYTPFQQFTKVASHELAEAVTDPAGNAWYDSSFGPTRGEEVGDLCNGYGDIVTYHGYTVQREWSNQQFQATGNGHFLLTNPIFSATAVTATAGEAFTGTVAAIADRDPYGSAADYTATIDWGDGHTSAGAVVAGPSGGFVVTGGNTYAAPGAYAVTVTIHDGPALPVVVTGSADVPATQSGAWPAHILATGADAGGAPLVNVYDAQTGQLLASFDAYDPHFQGGVRVAVADVTGDGTPDVITAPGPGGGPDVRVWDGATGSLVREFMAYDPAFSGGVFVAAADVNGDGKADVITGAGAGGGPDVRAWDGAAGGLLREFYAYDPAFQGGVRVAAGDVTGDGVADVVTAPGAGGGPDVRVFDGKTGGLAREFYAYDPLFTGGVYVAAGDVDGDGRADIVTGAGAGGGPDVRIFSGRTGALAGEFYAYDPQFPGGVRVAVADVGGKSEVVTAPGPGTGPLVQLFDPASLQTLDSFFAYDQAFTGGVFVGA